MVEPVDEKRAEVERILDEIVDPCSAASGVPIGLVGMGIVDSIAIDDGMVTIRLLPTFPGCIYTGVFANEINEKLGSLDWTTGIDVELIADADIWDEGHMTEEARNRLTSVREERRRRAAARSR